jgi:hypothetical protein
VVTERLSKIWTLVFYVFKEDYLIGKGYMSEEIILSPTIVNGGMPPCHRLPKVLLGEPGPWRLHRKGASGC